MKLEKGRMSGGQRRGKPYFVTHLDIERGEKWVRKWLMEGFIQVASGS
jgi:hypothetical protein